jgi:acetyl-CoA C-acetyltransferase
MRRAAIVDPVRTPIGAFGGSLRPLSAADLATAVIRAVVQRSGVDPDQIEDVAFARWRPRTGRGFEAA